MISQNFSSTVGKWLSHKEMWHVIFSENSYTARCILQFLLHGTFLQIQIL